AGPIHRTLLTIGVAVWLGCASAVAQDAPDPKAETAADAWYVLDMQARAVAYADRILRGAKPGDLPIEEPTTFELAINRKAGRELGVPVPTSLLLRADRLVD